MGTLETFLTTIVVIAFGLGLVWGAIIWAEEFITEHGLGTFLLMLFLFIFFVGILWVAAITPAFPTT